MKYRTDFVTNSSSSCYVVAFKSKYEFDGDTLQKYPFLGELGDVVKGLLMYLGSESSETERGTIVSSETELRDYFIKHLGYRNLDEELKDDQNLLDSYNKALKPINEGYAVLFKWVDYDDTAIIEIVKVLKEKGFDIQLLSEDL